MAWAMSPTQQAKYRCESVKPLFNFSLVCCAACRIRRSPGQYNRSQTVCDRCHIQGRKPA